LGDNPQIWSRIQQKILFHFSNMHTCVICGIMKLYNFSHTLKKIPNIFNLDDIPIRGCTCYEITNILMAHHTMSKDCSKISTTCNWHIDIIAHQFPHVVYHTLDYMRDLLKAHLLKVQLLSFLHISIPLDEHKYDFFFRPSSWFKFVK
jgi:hypothetical protein